MSDVRLSEFWKAVKARLDVPEYRAVAGGLGRVFLITENYEQTINNSELFPENRPWGFTVILNARTLWPQTDFHRRPVVFLCRTECNDFSSASYDPAVTLERMQEIIKDRLHNWIPTGIPLMRAAFRVYRNVPPQTMSEWEEQDRRWWLSTEYRTEAVAA